MRAGPGRQALVLAGGLGTRMRPHTERVPKFLLEVAGRPFGDWLLERLAACGYDDVVLSVAHLGEQIREHVGGGERFGLRVRYVDEGQELRGTGGALRLARSQGTLEGEVLVTYGDSYLPFDYAAPLDQLRESPGLGAVMAVFRNRSSWDASNVELDPSGGLVLRYEKGSSDPALDCIDYGATALRAVELDAYAEGARFGFDELQTRLARAGRMGACVAAERFYEIGSEAGLADLNARLRGPNA